MLAITAPAAALDPHALPPPRLRYVLRIPHEGRMKCVSAFMPHRDDQNRKDWLLGAPFFRRHLVVFDRRKHRIGLAEKASAASVDRGYAPPDDQLDQQLDQRLSVSQWEL